MTTVSILEDELVMLDSLHQSLDRAGLPVLHATHDASAFVTYMRGSPSDVAIIDLKLSDREATGGIQVLEDVFRLAPQVKTVVLSAVRAPEVVDKCLKLGASAYLFKHHANVGQVVEAVKAVARGEKLVPVTSLSEGLPAGTTDGVERAPSELANLTAREHDVLRFVSSGADNKRIAEQFGITQRTVKAHLANLYRKLGVENRTQLALKARELGVGPIKP